MDGLRPLVNTYTFEVQRVSQVVAELVERLRPHARQLGCTPYLEHVLEMAHTASWTEIQLKALDETNDRAEVVRRLCNMSRISQLRPEHRL